MAGGGEGARAVLTLTPAGPGVTDAGSRVLGLHGCRNPWLGARVCVCFHSFLLLKPQFSSLQNGQAMILASISPWFSQRGSLYFDDTGVSGNSVSPTLLPQASYKNQSAGKTVSHGGRRGYSALEGLQRHSCFMKFTIFQPPLSPQGYGPVHGGGTAWEGVLTLLQGGRGVTGRGGAYTSGGGNSLQRHQALGRPAVAP